MRVMRALGGVKLLILDDWGLEPLGPEQRHDMLEIIEDRYGRGATLITSQIPVDRASVGRHRWLLRQPGSVGARNGTGCSRHLRASHPVPLRRLDQRPPLPSAPPRSTARSRSRVHMGRPDWRSPGQQRRAPLARISARQPRNRPSGDRR
ncbi:MAG: ATP-binding protein [Candidatus Eremiobacteraeota bacterium]|nr:ATP-binding protein [Candidatus Eremiobacteraeota bacterium]